MEAPFDDDDLPERIADVKIERRLGAGGMAEVFLGHGPGYPGPVVVKRILPNLALDALYVQMFRREAEVALSIVHPNIVKTFSVSDASLSVRPFIIMEFVDGLTLKELMQRQWLKGEPLPYDELCCAAMDAADALDFVHLVPTDAGQGFVHRDISPENLIVGRDGQTKVLDFGIARPEHTSALTKTGDLKGKIPYMAPEQVSGDLITGASDLYSLGVTLYWALSQKRPFDRLSELKTLNAIVDETPPPPAVFRQAVPGPFLAAVAQLLQKKPSERPARAADLATQLGSYATDAARGRLAARVDALMNIPLDVLKSDYFDRVAQTATSVERPVVAEITASTWSSYFSTETAPTRSVRGSLPAPRTPAMRAGFSVGAVLLLLAAAGVAWALQKPAGPGRARAPIVAQAGGAPFPLLPEGKATVPDANPAVSGTGVPAADPAQTPKPRPAAAVTVAPKPRVNLTVSGPGFLRWQDVGGQALAIKKGRVVLSALPRRVVAVDTRFRSRHVVPVIDGRANFNALQSGTLTVRAVPYATVHIGTRRLGETPLNDVPLVEGDYIIRLTHEGRDIEKRARIAPGGSLRIPVNFNRE